jgi:quinol-cytochrome oxidoreductase complex cytochrome b subunit
MVLAAELLVLAVTGILLFFFYRPSAAQAWDDIGPGLAGSLTFSSGLRDTHLVMSRLAMLTAASAGVLVAIAPLRRGRRAGSVALGAGMFVLVMLGSATGYLLPWDQLALWAVTVGTNMRGYTPLMGDQVRFVLLDGKEIGNSTLLRWVFIHMAVFGLGAMVLVALAWSRLRSLRDEFSTRGHRTG